MAKAMRGVRRPRRRSPARPGMGGGAGGLGRGAATAGFFKKLADRRLGRRRRSRWSRQLIPHPKVLDQSGIDLDPRRRRRPQPVTRHRRRRPASEPRPTGRAADDETPPRPAATPPGRPLRCRTAGSCWRSTSLPSPGHPPGHGSTTKTTSSPRTRSTGAASTSSTRQTPAAPSSRSTTAKASSTPPTPAARIYGEIETGLQALIQRRNPVSSSAWRTRFRGFVEDYDYSFDPSQQVNRLTVTLVDLFERLSTIEMTPRTSGGDGFGDVATIDEQGPGQVRHRNLPVPDRTGPRPRRASPKRSPSFSPATSTCAKPSTRPARRR